MVDGAQVAALEAALGRAGRDRLLGLIAEHARSGGRAVADAAAAGDEARARREAHGLRGAMASVGAAALTAVLRDIEHEGPDAPRLDALARAAEAVAREAERLLAG